MDWDDVQAKPAKTFSIGDPLDTLSIGELEARLAALGAEIDRVKAEIDAKRKRAEAANAFFKS